jgi:hypothetical protein
VKKIFAVIALAALAACKKAPPPPAPVSSEPPPPRNAAVAYGQSLAEDVQKAKRVAAAANKVITHSNNETQKLIQD